MSQIASFYLIKNNQRQELSDGDCSGLADVVISQSPGTLPRSVSLTQPPTAKAS